MRTVLSKFSFRCYTSPVTCSANPCHHDFRDSGAGIDYLIVGRVAFNSFLMPEAIAMERTCCASSGPMRKGLLLVIVLAIIVYSRNSLSRRKLCARMFCCCRRQQVIPCDE